jgi:tyrosyl-tRNA synthetase
MYGKLMSVSDELMWKYWTFLTDKTQSEIDAMRERVTNGELHPMLAKKDLAHAITTDFHSAAAADEAARGWATMFQSRGISEDVPEVSVPLTSEGLTADDGALRLPKLLVLAGLAASAGEATRKLGENAVSINGEKFSERTVGRAQLGESPTLRLGKKAVRVRFDQ